MARQQSYYNNVYNAARSLGASDLQAHLAASQASLETGYGRSVKGNNHFGIKAGSKYTGDTVTFATHEFYGGKKVGETGRFRAYDNLKDSVRGYMEFMAANFPAAWNATNLDEATQGLKQGRYGAYATDPNYKGKVTSIAGTFGPAAVGQAFLPTPTNSPLPATFQAPTLPSAVPTQSVRTSTVSLAPPSPALGAAGGRELQGYVAPNTSFAAPLGPVERASLPALASPAMAARAASELQGYIPSLPAAPSPSRPDNRASTGPRGMGGPGGTYVGAIPERTQMDPDMGRLTTAAIPPALASIMAPPTSMTPPTMNAGVAPRSVQATDVPLSSIGTFPDAPKSPGRQAAGAIAKGALAGLVTGGLPGAIIGGLVGPARAQISRNVAHNRQNPTNRISPFNNMFGGYRGLFGSFGNTGGLGGLFSGIPAPNYGAPQYGIGSGYSAIGGAFGAPAGATAYSSSNPNISFTSLGNGYVSRSNAEYGTTSILGPGDYDPGTSSGKSGRK